MNIVWHGPAFDPSGYGSCSRSYLRALNESGHNIRLESDSYYHGVPVNNYLSSKEIEYFGELTKNQVVKDIIDVEHKTSNLFTLPKSNFLANIGYTVWETNKLPNTHAECLKYKDIIWTASNFSKNAILNSYSRSDVRVIPHILSGDIYKPSTDICRSDKTIVFVFVGEYTYRKGVDKLIEAFTKCFDQREDVVLIIKTHILNNKSQKENLNNIKKHIFKYEESVVKSPLILPEIRFYDTDKMAKLYQRSHIFISATRGEGFGLPIAEAMACGCSVIVPDKGGHKDFVDEDNSYMFKCDWVDVDNDKLEKERSVYKGQQWLEPDIESLMAVMEEAYTDATLDTDFTDKGTLATKIVEELNSDKIVKIMESNIK